MMLWVGHEFEFRVGVHVNEARADHRVRHINHPRGFNLRCFSLYYGDYIFGNSQASAIPGLAGTVYDSPVSKQKVEHSFSNRIILLTVKLADIHQAPIKYHINGYSGPMRWLVISS